MLGIDIAKDKFDAALLRDGKYKTKTFANTPKGFKLLLSWLAALDAREITVCMEATGTYGEVLALFLNENGHPVSVVNPARIKAFTQAEGLRNKTDAVDAKAIARFALAHQPEVWQPLPANVRALQALVRRLEALNDLHQQECNRRDTSQDCVQDSITNVITTLESEIAAVKRRIRDMTDNDPDLRNKRELLESVPGIGPATSAHLLSWMAAPERFHSAKAAAAFTGLTPRREESGTSLKRRGGLSKMGDARIRKALYMPAVVAQRHNPVMKAFAQRLLDKGKPKMLVIGAIMRKLVQLAYAILKNNTPFDPKFALAR